MKESDLYAPLKAYLEAQNYEVKSEVMDCDLVARRADELPVVIELKKSLNLTVLLQAVDRLAISPKVYIGIPSSASILKGQYRKSRKLLRMLGIGLISINPNASTKSVNVLLDPGSYESRISLPRKERLLGEFEKRVGDPNQGGMEKRRGVMTAYRQQAVTIAEYLRKYGPTKASKIAEALSITKSRNILYRDVYGWFDRHSKGIYGLSPRGERELDSWLLRLQEAE